MINRLANLPKQRSFLLFGARGTGKSTLLKSQFKGLKTKWIDLLDDNVLEIYLQNPQQLRQEIEALSQDQCPEWVVIDEVQKAPKLLNVVHQWLESKQSPKFALTGSSARKLKQKGVNLLAGRAFVENLFPCTAIELANQFDLMDALQWGTLPSLSTLPDPSDKQSYLRSYTQTYLKTEIQEEQWVRQIEPFRKFLPIAAQMNGRPLNYSSIAKDTGVSSLTVQSYYQILEDTLLGFFLPAFHRSIRKQQRVAPKFYLFDLGVKRALGRQLQTPLSFETTEFGHAFEHFVICELYRLNHYYRKDYELSYLLTKSNVEIDLILDRPAGNVALIEIKSASKVDERHTRQLEEILGALKNSDAYLLSLDPNAKKIGNVWALPWDQGLVRLME